MAATPQFGAQVNQVGVAPTTGDSAKQAAANLINSDSNVIDVAGLATQSLQLSNAMKSSDANRAKSDYVSLITSEGYRNADNTDKAEMFESAYSNVDSKSDAYTSAFRGYSAGEYSRRFDARGVEQDNSLYNAAGASYSAWGEESSGVVNTSASTKDSTIFYSNKEAGKSAKDFVDYYKTTNPRLNNVTISRTMSSEAINEAILTINLADPTREDLTRAQEDANDILLPYQDPMFMTTEESQGKEYYAGLKTKLTVAIKNKNKEIVEASQGRVADAKNQYMSNTTIGPNPMGYGNDIIEAYKGPLKQQSAIKELNKAYTENVERVSFLSGNTPVDRREPIPVVAKKAWQKRVTSAATNAFINGDYTTTIQAIINNPGYAKEVGDTMYQSFNQAETTKELTGFIDKINIMNTYDRGGTAIRQAVGDDEYTEMIAVHALSTTSLYKGDLAGARRLFNDSKNNYIPMTKDLSQTMTKHQVKLGRHYGAYSKTMITLNNINPAIAKSKEAEVRDSFLSQTKEYGNINKDKLIVDTSMAGDILEEISLLPEKDAADIIAELGETSTMIMLPNGQAQLLDEWGGNSRKVNLTKYAEDKNLKVEKIKLLVGNSIPVTDQIVGAVVNIAEDVYEALPGVFDSLRDTFTTDSYLEGLERLEKIKALHSTTNNEEIDNDTRDDTLKAEAEYAQQKNDLVVKAVDDAINVMKEQQLKSLPKDTKDAIFNAKELSLEEFTALGHKDNSGLVTTQGYSTDKYQNDLPDFYFRKIGKIYKVNY